MFKLSNIRKTFQLTLGMKYLRKMYQETEFSFNNFAGKINKINRKKRKLNCNIFNQQYICINMPSRIKKEKKQIIQPV